LENTTVLQLGWKAARFARQGRSNLSKVRKSAIFVERAGTRQMHSVEMMIYVLPRRRCAKRARWESTKPTLAEWKKQVVKNVCMPRTRQIQMRVLHARIAQKEDT
jgi:hypothetical protein